MSKQSIPGNPHLQGADNGELPYESFAIAQATLALAYEQRTANLIAWHAVVDGEDPIIEDLYAQIHSRLGL